jgi:hypothetical protein
MFLKHDNTILHGGVQYAQQAQAPSAKPVRLSGVVCLPFLVFFTALI